MILLERIQDETEVSETDLEAVFRARALRRWFRGRVFATRGMGAPDVKVHLVDGTDEQFGLRCAVAPRSDFAPASDRVRASRAVTDRMRMRVCDLDLCPLSGGDDVGGDHVGLRRTRMHA
jgi:hypothetical protein